MSDSFPSGLPARVRAALFRFRAWIPAGGLTRALIRAWAVFALPLFLVAGCGGHNTVQRETEIFGTRAEIIVSQGAEDDAGGAIAAAFAQFHESHRRFHPWREGETAAINRAVAAGDFPVAVSAEMSAILSLSAEGEAKSGGVFNPAIGTLVSLWGFHSETLPTAPPAPSDLAEWLKDPPTLQTMLIRDGALLRLHRRARLDFGAVVKGAALDDARRILAAHGIRNALVNVGGNILALGKNGGRKWRVALRPAQRAEAIGATELEDGETVAVSGGGERFFVYDGVRHNHILDPRTARPAKKVWSAGVIVPAGENAGALSDIAATSLVVAKDDAAAEAMLAAFGISAAFRLSPDGELWMTPEMKKRLARPAR